MITLEKLLSELNSGSLNEIIAGGGNSKCGKGSKGAKSKKQKSVKVKKSKKTKRGCPPGSPAGCQ